MANAVKKPAAVLLVLIMMFVLIPVNNIYAASGTTLTFSSDSIIASSSGNGYSIDGTILTITADGVYTITGSCSEGSIVVNKGLSNVVLILDDLTLSSSEAAPVVVKKTSSVIIHLEGTSTLTDNENPDDENSEDADIADAFEGAALKVKSGSSVTFCGDGNLNIVANAKNGIKGGSGAALTFNSSGTIRVSGNYSGTATSSGAVNNGIASDGTLTINCGTFDIDAANDGIKSVPDADDTASAGGLYINGGTFDIDVDGDGIQADSELVITAGTFDIKTMNGYSTSGTKYSTNGRTSSSYAFDPDSMSCKGIKASGDRGLENQLKITGGIFTLNTADDALHSDAYVLVTGGLFTIDTGDDGAHADTTLELGSEGGYERDPDITINHSYEGLEGGTVYTYSGRYYVTASDDGINAAGGSSNGSDPGSGGKDPFNPGGNRSGGGNGPGGRSGFSTMAAASDYNIYIYGGDFYINCDGDGLDSNGGLYLYGGNLTVFSMAGGGDNSAIDRDGTLVIDGATIFTAGSAGMDGSVASTGSSQKYKSVTTNFSANAKVNVTDNGSVVYSDTLPKRSTYTFYSAPSASSLSISSASSVSTCKSNDWNHNWDSGVQTGTDDSGNIIMKYTCSSCGKTEYMTVAQGAEYSCDGHESEEEAEEETDEGFAITFDTDDGVGSVDIYYTQDYTSADETGVTSAVSRNSDTGEPDSTGSGQLNFTVNLKDGYTLSAVSATEGSYKNIKGPSDTGAENTYRITKITGDMTVMITTEQEETAEPYELTGWNWSEDDENGYTSATAVFFNGTDSVEVEAEIITETVEPDEKNPGYIKYTAVAVYEDVEYTESKTVILNPTGVEYQLDSIEWTADEEGGYTVSFEFVSKTDDSDTVTEEVKAIQTEESYPETCTTDGKTIYYASVEFDDGLYESTKEDIIDAYGHSYDLSGWEWADDYSSAKAIFECGNDSSHVLEVKADISSETENDTIIYTASVILDDGATYSDTQTKAIEDDETADEGFAITFDTDEGVGSVDIYYTQDYTSADETGVTSSVSRSSDTGEPDSTGSGQLNFTVVLKDGYTLSNVSATEGTYKNIKGPSDTGAENTYRITKITGDMTVTITTKEDDTTDAVTDDTTDVVTDDSTIAVTGLTITPASSELATKKTLQLKVTVTPSNATNQAVTWTSSDPSVAKVDANGKVTALKYGKPVTITATSKDNGKVVATATIQTRFYDVNDTSKYYWIPVYWGADNGIIKGYTDDKTIASDSVYFGPQQTCMRKDYMILLYRLAGKPAVSGTTPFTDVEGKYGRNTDTYKAILWGYQKGIIKGFDAKTFGPERYVNRKDAMIMLYRYAGKPAVKANTSKFSDVQGKYKTSSDTFKSIVWGTEKGITKGYTSGQYKGQFRTMDDCLREHIATFIYRYAQKVKQ